VPLFKNPKASGFWILFVDSLGPTLAGAQA